MLPRISNQHGAIEGAVVRPRVLVAHPGRQHSHQLALALLEKGMLAAYLHGAPLPEQFAGRFPTGLRAFVPIASAIRKAARAIGGSNLDRRAGAFADGLFDRLAAVVLRHGKYDAVIGYEMACEHVFAAARKAGMRTILDAASLHHSAQRRLLGGRPPDSDVVVARKDREIALADAILTCSPLAAASYIEAGVGSQKVHALALGADHEGAIAEKSAPLNRGCARFAFVGSISPHKGADLLAQAVKKLRAQCVDFELTVVADHVPNDRDFGLAALANCRPRMAHPRLMEFLAAQDCVVLPSRFDSFGLVVGEALACGCAAIVSEHVGAKELVKSCDAGIVTRTGNADSLADAMREFAASVDSWRSRRTDIRNAASHHDWAYYRARAGALVGELAANAFSRRATEQSAAASTSLRPRTRVCQPAARGKRVLMLATDAFGGFGGISRFNRDFCAALSHIPDIGEVEILVRLAPEAVDAVPERVKVNLAGLGSVAKYVFAALRAGLFGPRPDLVFCGHIHLLPLAWLVARCRRSPLFLQVHGIDVWRPSPSRVANRLVSFCDAVVSVSQVTLTRMSSWAAVADAATEILPNSVRIPAANGLGRVTRQTLGIEARHVMLTLGRMVGEERAKGFDEIIDILPRLVARGLDVAYVAAGGGPDLERLKDKARRLGVADRVIFPGRIAEEEKSDYYRLADAFVMPSRGEGFGIVLLEAMAHGLPVLASSVDGGREAVCDGELGMLADPGDPDALEAALVSLLSRPRAVPAGLERFGFPRFCERVAAILTRRGVLGPAELA